MNALVTKISTTPLLALALLVAAALAACTGAAPTAAPTEVPVATQASPAHQRPREEPAPTRTQAAPVSRGLQPAATPVSHVSPDPSPSPPLPRDPTPEPETTPEPTPAADLSPREVSGLSPVPSVASAAGASASDWEREPETVEDLLAEGPFLSGAGAAHMALRAVPVAGSFRCEWLGSAYVPDELEELTRFLFGLGDEADLPTFEEKRTRLEARRNSVSAGFRPITHAENEQIMHGGYSTGVLQLNCFADYQVSEYLLGSGPDRVTLAYHHPGNETGWSAIEWAIEQRIWGDQTPENLARDEYEAARLHPRREHAKEQLETAVYGRDNVMFIHPAGGAGNIAVEVWTVGAQWDLQMVNGVLTAVRYAVSQDEAEYSQTFDNLKSRVTTAAATDALAGKRVVTIAGIAQHYRDLGAYGDITPYDGEAVMFTPSKPPPVQVCGDDTALDRDCGTLLGVEDDLAGTATLNWSATLAMDGWTGITTGGSPTRVTGISLPGSSLSGSVPGGLSHLQSLSTLDLSGNQLTGSIPGQLANLPALATLKLSGNSLSGCIPGGLRDVATHDLASLSLNYCDATAPDPVATFTANVNGETSVKLDWTVPDDNHAPITGYDLQRRIGDLGAWIDVTPAPAADANTFFVTGLEKTTRYSFRLRAVNDAGKAGWGKGSGARTRLLSPALVTGVSAAPSGSSSITVTWNPRAVDDDNSISGYRLQRRTETTTSNAAAPGTTARATRWTDVSPAPSADATSYADTGLKQNTTYAYRMRALNSAGTSRWSEAASATTEAAPPVPSGLTLSLSNGTFTLAWSANSDLVKFEAEHRRAATEQWAALPEVTGTSTSYTPKALPTCSDSWEFRLRGFGDGESHAAEWSGWLSPVAYTSAAINNPQNFPGLVRDCNILLQGKDTLRGTATSLNWGIERNMGRWTGFGAGDGVDGVHSLYLDDLGLNGTIPAGFGGLAELYRLDLAGNQLTGAIPSTFGSLTKLELMYLGNNQLSGSLPAELGSMSSLKEFSTYANQSITGSIPTELGNLSNLRRLELTNNNLTGQIPTEFGRLKELRSLRMSHNALTGSIPSGLGALTYLHELLLASNQLGGCIPRSLMDISTNDFSSPGMPGFCTPPASEQ